MAKTVVTIEDTRSAAGGEGKHGMRMEVDGEMVELENDPDGGFKCTVNNKKYHFSDEEIAEMLHEQL